MSVTTKTQEIDYFCTIPEYVWHKVLDHDGIQYLANCGYKEYVHNAEMTSCVFIGLRCPHCFDKDEFFSMEQCGFGD